MPRSAIATGLADFVLPVDKMPPVLEHYVRHYYVNGGPEWEENEPNGSHQLLALLLARTKLDFRCYRKKMLNRRIERRMSLGQFEKVADYLAFLRENLDEVKLLSRDLLISVTSFFRDPEAWRALDTHVVAPLVRAKGVDEPVRVWCVGCATGEEPYSLGMLLLEQLAKAQKNCPVQIFATDIDEEALEIARQATYPESISADVSPERLVRFFSRVSDSAYHIGKQLREAVVVARQNLITDAPFSKLDLIVCRNLLIYLEPDTQKKVISLLHFALNPGGALFLGPSETIGRQIDLFEPVLAKWRIYRRIGATRVENVRFPVVEPDPGPNKRRPTELPQPPLKLAELAQNFLLRRFALAAVVINRNHDVLHYAGPTEDYLIQPGGPPTHDLLSMARPGLESKLRVVIQRAIRQNAPQSAKEVLLRLAGRSRRVNIDVEPLTFSKQTEGLLLVAFQEQPEAPPETPAQARAKAEDRDVMRQLEQELETTREGLQGAIEELESSNEGLKASNEEVMSMNEELQSTNEELETSKEELQSLNEELTTVNAQLHDKIQDVETTSNDLSNLLNCTDIATIFLDTSFRIKRFTPASTQLFNLVAADVGRPIGDIARKFTDDELLREAERFLHDLLPREKEIRLEDGRWCVRRIVPYRTHDNRIEGVVITFVDITERKQAADAVVRGREEYLRAILNTAADAIITIDERGTIKSVNPAAERLFGYLATEMLGQNVSMLMPSPFREEHDRYLRRYLETGQARIIGIGREVLGRRRDGSIFPADLAVSRIESLKLFTGVVRDIARRKELEREVVEIASQEQRRIGQDLHDRVGQELAALNLLVGDLAEILPGDPPQAGKLVDRIAQGLHRSQGDLRDVLRGLLAVSIETQGLPAALTELAQRAASDGKLACTFDCPRSVEISDSYIATHVFFIAQEAVQNALKHARAATVRISLKSNGLLVLRVQDDGRGMPARPADSGLGLRIMRYRAAMIGGTLSIEPAEPHGTVVTCTWSKNYEAQK
jgi:two-component system CheB/CheR fusion protein